jgi:hypothetical protein
LPGSGEHRVTPPTLGTVEGVFFWVFNDEKSLKEEQVCKFNAGNRITLDLSHLTSIDFSNKSEELLYALLSQAMEQTHKAEDIASLIVNIALLQPALG